MLIDELDQDLARSEISPIRSGSTSFVSVGQDDSFHRSLTPVLPFSVFDSVLASPRKRTSSLGRLSLVDDLQLSIVDEWSDLESAPLNPSTSDRGNPIIRVGSLESLSEVKLGGVRLKKAPKIPRNQITKRGAKRVGASAFDKYSPERDSKLSKLADACLNKPL